MDLKGLIIFLCDTNKVRALFTGSQGRFDGWGSSTLAAETLALLDGASTAVYVAPYSAGDLRMWEDPYQMFLWTNPSVVEALYTYKLVDNKRLRIDISNASRYVGSRGIEGGNVGGDIEATGRLPYQEGRVDYAAAGGN
ncbi:hypothetical protein GWK47_050161 [Chionoecetes opilio]|uniref:Uncharacterized protein n=1 Tax=Chionoecetes opilio TaxID=41210 RepID=A0A8J4YA98_CHIOP|nr:hypothetical protein GWK47_050161 [Chionoecetes opilio]